MGKETGQSDSGDLDCCRDNNDTSRRSERYSRNVRMRGKKVNYEIDNG